MLKVFKGHGTVGGDKEEGVVVLLDPRISLLEEATALYSGTSTISS